MNTVAQNLLRVRERIAAAAGRCGRSEQEITLVGVAKYVDAEATRALVEAGCHDIGESRPQQLWDKAAALQDLPQVRWHMIGHLQRNKVRRTLPLLSVLHSVDSLRLLQTIRQQAPPHGLPILLEVNVSGDPGKHGFDPQQLERVWDQIAESREIETLGLMCMASRTGGRRRAREDFARLRQLRDRLRGLGPATLDLPHLSMGMSGDFEEAIAEGATMVRIGSVLLEGLPA